MVVIIYRGQRIYMAMSAKIDTTVNEKNELTSYWVNGQVTTEQIISTIEDYYSGRRPTKHVLWNFSSTHIHHLKGFEIERIANAALTYSGIENPLKTALVFASKADFGVGRMFEAFSHCVENPKITMCFYTLEEALKWLDEGMRTS